VRISGSHVHNVCVSPRVRRASLTTLSNGGLSIARAVVSFFTVSMLVQYLGRDSYGLSVTITGMAAWLSVAQGGIGQSVKNEMIRQPDSAGSLFAGAFASLLGIVSVVGLFLTGAARFLPWKQILNAPDFHQPNLILFSLWIVLFTALLSLVRATYAAFQSEFKLAPAMLAGLLLSFLFVLAGIRGGYSLAVVVSASLLPNLIGLAVGLLLMPRVLGIRLSFPRKLYRAGLWFFIIEACTILIFQADVFLVNLFLGQAKATVFALHFQLFFYLQTAVTLVVSPYWAAFGDAWKSNERAWLKSSVLRLALAIALLSATGVVLLLAIGRPLMNLWSHGQVEWNPALALAIGANVIIQAVTGVYATALGSLGIARDPARVVILQAVLNIGVCIWLIRRFGLLGGAIGSLATYALTSGLYLPYKVRQAIA
jgi:O-antigen/teichoic acid export membrane protein